jgi:4-amino-4-deoxy-L-arabinose transferase-like glycosyltransferase
MHAPAPLTSSLKLPGALLAGLAAVTVIRIAVAASTGLTEDEAYYRLWALAPALSYLDHPPMVGWMIAAGRWIAGDNSLGVRFAALATSVVGTVVLWRSALILFGREVAERATWLVLAMPLLAVGGVVITPDTPSVLFWGLVGWSLAELQASGKANWWLAVGFFAGLGLLSKYTNLFVGAGIAMWLMLLPGAGRWLRSWQLWAGGVLALLLALPVLVWNAQHGWASFFKQFGRVTEGDALTLGYLLELLGGFLGLASPAIAVLAGRGLGRVYRGALKRDPACLLLASGVLPLLVYLAVHSLHDRVQPNWTAPLYPSLAICAAIATWPARGTPYLRPSLRAFHWATGIGFALSGLLLLHAVVPLVVIPGTRDPTSQLRGWTGFAAEVEQLRSTSGACWIATASYATTGELAYALGSKAPVIQLTERIRYLHLPPPPEVVRRCPGLFVDLERRASPEMLQGRFRAVSFAGRIVRGYHGVTIATYAAFKIAGANERAFTN